MLKETEIFTNISLGVNETKAVVGPEHGLGEYEYTISAINSAGVTTTDVNTLCK